ncbi:coiled-coil domain-containing protein 55 [Plectosphaerella plurivora]|uniref:Coiled-coil domain-containing protein 55 n=1 Tax=Plectosphaerella plurivora TaxID=936078 RepID=A0A9P9ACL9_9PEZI|nr:coiled-coil domain-containing protein 55 [Plectosphaerella plurivora]
MSKPGLSFGLNLGKKSGASKKAPPKTKTAFGGGDDSDDDVPAKGNGAIAIGELDDFDMAPQQEERTSRKSKNAKNALPARPPTLKSKTGAQATPMFGDLAGSLTSRKNAEAAEQLDPSVYDYDKVYDSFKPQNHKKDEAAAERKPRYMSSVIAAAAVRKRDALIAEEKKIARDREAEGDEFAGKEKFVTEAYKRQQEENRRLEAEEKAREEAEEKKNKAGGMNAFYKGMLDRGEQRHKEIMEAAEAKAKSGPQEEEEQEEEKDEGGDERARKINELGGKVAVNEEGQVVDKRQLLRGGLNIDARVEARVERDAAATRKRQKEEEERRRRERAAEAAAGAFIGEGGRGAMRERQTRMMEAQLEAALKRTREEEEEEQAKVERATKTRKTEGEIMSAKERYLARKREAEEAKKKAAAE